MSAAGSENGFDAATAAEQSLLGALMIDGAAWPKVAGTVSAIDLHRPDHRLIFAAIAELAAAGTPADVVTVSDQLDRGGKLTDAGGLAYLATLANETPSAANIVTYAALVRERSRLRQLERLSSDVLERVRSGDAAADILQRLQADLPTLTVERAPDRLDIIRAAIRSDLGAGPDVIDAAAPPRWVCPPVLPVAGATLAGPGGTGKTTLVLGEMVRIVGGGELYSHEVELQGHCVLVTAEDGAAYARYLLQRVLADGIDRGQLPERAAARAKAHVHIIGWQRATYGPIVEVGELGDMRRAPVYDLLLELIEPIRPVYMTLDPAVLFGAGERYGNDGDAYLAAMLHETALTIGACVQLADHVSQTVAREGIIDQHAARGGTAKSDNARLARQLVRVTPENAAGLTLPPALSTDDIAEGRVLRLHWTKSNYAPLPPPVWLRRHGRWAEYLRAPSAQEAAAHEQQEQAQQVLADAAVIVEHVRAQLAIGEGIRQSQADVERARPRRPDGAPMPRDRVREAVRYALATGRLRHRELPETERHGQRRHYLTPADPS